MHTVLYDLKNLIADEIADVVEKRELNKETLCNLDKAVDIYKDIMEMESKGMEGETNGVYAVRGSYRYPDTYHERTATNGTYYENGDKQKMREHYERELRRATSEPERENIRRMMRELDNM